MTGCLGASGPEALDFASLVIGTRRYREIVFGGQGILMVFSVRAFILDSCRD